MNFVSGLFVGFFLLVLTVFIVLPPRYRMAWLLLVSYLFYATWSLPFIAVILFTTSVDYWMSLVIARSSEARTRKAALFFALVVNLLVLGFFKYGNFLLHNAHGLADLMGVPLALPASMHILLPLGISFYTFEAISYLVDVYRGERPARSWLNYNFYIMYFPHLISGPIVRFHELFPQYESPLRRPSLQRIAHGVELILLGYVFKVMIADPAGMIADPVFHHPAQATAFSALLGTMAFTTQIYFDFMGYTHIARGASLLLNLALPVNFNHPYLASNISNFWERWHISLSRWIRDYLYIPLGGSRGILAATMFNLILTMFIAGAWHGAGWTFILWGGYHGVLLAGYHLYKTLCNRVLGDNTQGLLAFPVYSAFSHVLTSILVMLGWVLFRATSLADVRVLLGKLFQFNNLAQEVGYDLHRGDTTRLMILALLAACCFTGSWVIRLLAGAYRPMPYWLKVQVACFAAILIWILTASGTQPFIYFQF